MGSSGCVWCGGGPATREHIVPQWLAAVLSEISPSAEGYDFGYIYNTADQRGEPRTYSQPLPELVVRAVCGACNNGWMADLEGEVQRSLEPMVRGHSARLDLDAQVNLARWVSKIAVLIGDYAPGAVILDDGDCDTISRGAPRRWASTSDWPIAPSPTRCRTTCT